MALNSESIDLRGLAVQCDSLIVDGVAMDTTDMSNVADIVADLTATAVELNYNDISVLGTGAASKAVVLDSGEDYTWPATGVLTYGVLKDPAGTTLGATVAELNMAADSSANCEVVSATNVIAAAESGSTYFLNSATEFVSTLPACALGLRYTFIVTAAPSGASYTVVATGATTTIKGHVLSNDLNAGTDADFGTAGEHTITFVDSKAVAGDRVDVISDGTNWFMQASCSVFDAITLT